MAALQSLESTRPRLTSHIAGCGGALIEAITADAVGWFEATAEPGGAAGKAETSSEAKKRVTNKSPRIREAKHWKRTSAGIAIDMMATGPFDRLFGMMGP